MFGRNSTEECYSINITDDGECEYDGCESESLLSQLSADDYNIQLVNDTVRVTIEDAMEDECSKVSKCHNDTVCKHAGVLSGHLICRGRIPKVGL